MSPESIDSTELRAVAAAFRLGGSYCGGAPYGTGHINDTFAISFEQGGVTTRYILQRINENVFRNVDAVMENVARVTAHAGRRAVASGAPVFVTQHGRVTAVLLSRDRYEHLRQRSALAEPETAAGGTDRLPGTDAHTRPATALVETRFGPVEPETADFLKSAGF